MILFDEKYKAAMNSVKPDPSLLDKILCGERKTQSRTRKKILLGALIPAAVCAICAIAVFLNNVYTRYYPSDPPGTMMAYDGGSEAQNASGSADKIKQYYTAKEKEEIYVENAAAGTDTAPFSGAGLVLPSEYRETSRKEDEKTTVIIYENEDGGIITAIITIAEENTADKFSASANTEAVLAPALEDDAKIEREFEKDGRKYKITAQNISEEKLDGLLDKNK